MAWKKGPLPENTWGYGGIVRAGQDLRGGFEFADFQGEKVVLSDGTILSPFEVGLYDNSLTSPPSLLEICRAK